MNEFIDGQFLVASPYLPDDNFLRTVIFMVRHDSEGAFGLVLTRRSDMMLGEILESTMNASSHRDDAIYLGGPVEGPLCALHDDGNYADLECSCGLYVTSEQESLLAIANRTDIQARFFAGYSGWGPGQLEAEMDQGGWLVCPATAIDVFSDCEPLWEDLVKRVGRSVLRELVPAAGPGIDPQLN